MAGVVADNVQYERCCQCGKWVPYHELRYATVAAHLTPRWPEYGHHQKLDLCSTCAGESIDEVAQLIHDFNHRR